MNYTTLKSKCKYVCDMNYTTLKSKCKYVCDMNYTTFFKKFLYLQYLHIFTQLIICLIHSVKLFFNFF